MGGHDVVGAPRHVRDAIDRLAGRQSALNSMVLDRGSILDLFAGDAQVYFRSLTDRAS